MSTAQDSRRHIRSDDDQLRNLLSSIDFIHEINSMSRYVASPKQQTLGRRQLGRIITPRE